MASSALVGALRATLGLDTAAFEDGAKRANTAAGRLEKTLKRTFAGLSVGLIVGGLAAAAKSAINFADNMGKMAQRIGIPVEQLSALDLVAKLADVSLDSLATGVRKMSQAVAQVGRGSVNEAARAFQDLNISVRNTDGSLKSATQILAEVADRFSRMPDGIVKTNAAMAIFGRSGTDLIPMLNQGSEAMRRMMAQSDALGLTISGKTAKAAEQFNDNLTTLRGVLQGVTQTISNELVKAFGPLLQQLTDFAVKSNIASKIGAGFRDLILSMSQDSMRLSSALTQVGIAQAALTEAFTTSGRDMEIWKQAVADIRAETDRLNASLRAMNQGRVRGGTGSGAPWWSRSGTAIRQTSEDVATLTTKVKESTVAFRDFDIVSGEALLREKWEPAIKSLSDHFSDFAINVATATGSIKQNFKDMVSSLLEQAARAMLNRAFTSMFTNLFASAGAFGGGAAAPGFMHFGGPRQHGGPVFRGRAFPVGERGPELFVPNQSGTIVPNDAMAKPPIINIQPPAGFEARAQQRGGSTDIWFEEAVANLISNPRSRVSRALAMQGAGPTAKGR